MDKREQNSICCRVVTQAEREQVKKLWDDCFDDTAEFVQWYFDCYWHPQDTIGIFELTEGARCTAEKLQASAQVIPYELRVRGTDLSCGYIVGLNTAPEARNKGYAKRLMEACLCMQRERGQAISLLMPFEGQFYYRYGWQFCYFHQRIVINPDELRCAAKPWGTVHKVDLFESQAELERVYNVFVQHYHGTVNRTAEQWSAQLKDAEMENSDCFLIEDEAQQVQGYFLTTPEKGACYVREMAWCHEQAKAGMLYELMQHVNESEKLWLELPEDDSLKYQLATTKTDIMLYPFLMARVVDVKHCLEALCYAVHDAELLLDVRDEFAPWNTDVYHMVVCDGTAVVQTVTAEEKKILESSGIWTVTCSAEGLTQLVMGAEGAKMLLRQGLLQCTMEVQSDVIRLLQTLWPEQQNYINEYY